MIFLKKKKDMEIWYFLQMPQKDCVSKKIVLEYDLSCIIWEDGILFPGNMIFFLWTESERWSFSRNTRKYDIFVYMYKYMLKIWYSPEKIHLKVIDILDHILERVPTILCTFMDIFIGVFIYCFPVKKPQET